MIFKFEYWYRYNGDESDFDIVEIEADTLELAIQKVKEIRHWIFKITQIK